MSKRKLGPCVRCGKLGRESFSICADGNVPRPVCTVCDVALNALVLDFMHLPDAAKNIIAYIARKAGR